MSTQDASITPAAHKNLFHFDYRDYIRWNITRTWYLTVWLIFLSGVTVLYTMRQFPASPVSTGIILFAWLTALVCVCIGDFRHHYTRLTTWLKTNLFSSITNSLFTLLITLILASVFASAWDYAVARATIDPAMTLPAARPENVGASWGVIIGASKLLMTGTLEMKYLPRVWMAAGMVLFLVLLSAVVFQSRVGAKWPGVKAIVKLFWLVSIFAMYVLLVGLEGGGPFLSIFTMATYELLALAIFGLLYWQRVVLFRWKSFFVWGTAWPVFYLVIRLIARSNLFPVIDVVHWGGLMLTLIIAVVSIVVSFPLGVGLALARRSKTRGIPSWITLPIAGLVTLWGLLISTPGMLKTARGIGEILMAFWPVLIFIAAYLFQRSFKGNVISAASTIYIEFIRGVPLITILFMSILMAPFFFPQGVVVKNTVAVLAGYTLFTAAYVAEVVRGGLQSISIGQFEAADALGFNGLQKMRFIILPQALRVVIPAIVGQFIGVFKSSSLVGIVGLFDLMGIVASVTGNPRWQGLRTELYIFAAVIYFVGSFAMTSYSRGLENRLGRAQA